jgi:hypothetical protein
LTNTSLPASTLYNDNIDGTNFMSKPITNMTVTNGLASFDFSESPTGIISVASGTDQLLYRFGVIDIVRDAKGNVKKMIRK